MSASTVMHPPGVTPSDGGLPIMSGGKVIGGIGVNSANADQDEQCAKLALEALK